MFLFLLTEKNTKSWENIPPPLTCGKAKMPPRSLALAAGAIILTKYLILTNRKNTFINSCSYETAVNDNDHLICTILDTIFPKTLYLFTIRIIKAPKQIFLKEI